MFQPEKGIGGSSTTRINVKELSLFCRPDDLAQGRETLVDRRAFLESVARGARRVGPLASRQVHQVDLAALGRALTQLISVHLNMT